MWPDLSQLSDNIFSKYKKEEILWISINLEQDFRMKMLADNFLKPSSGDMVAFVRTVNAKNPILSVVTVHDQGFTNVRNANANLR